MPVKEDVWVECKDFWVNLRCIACVRRLERDQMSAYGGVVRAGAAVLYTTFAAADGSPLVIYAEGRQADLVFDLMRELAVPVGRGRAA